jgi:hypothetical protein
MRFETQVVGPEREALRTGLFVGFLAGIMLAAGMIVILDYIK